MWSKVAFLHHVKENWYLKNYASIVADWAIGEEETVIEDYLAKAERDSEKYPVREHYVVTDRRLLHFKLTRQAVDYHTVFTSDDIASIAQSFPVPAQPEYIHDYIERFSAPDITVTLRNQSTITFQAPPSPDDKDRFKRFVLALVSLFPKRKVE